jgi:hypothetical protein
VRVQIWDATHHMQRGWYQGEVPATQLQKIIGFLHQFSANKGTDAVIVSAQADLKTPGASTKIDPVNLWVLRELGFEAYLATSDRDVRLFDIKTSEGQQVTGIAGDKGPGKMSSELSIRRAKDALEKLSADRLTQEAALHDETDAGKRGEIEQALKDIGTQRAEIEAALEAYVKAGHQKLASLKPKGGHTTQSVNDALANEPAPAEKAALDAALTKYNFDRPVTSDLHLTDVALVLIKQPTSGARPEPGSPAARAHDLRESRSRITEIGLRIKKGESGPQIQQELVAELWVFKSLLETELNPPDPAQKLPEGASRTLIEATLKGVNEKLATVVEDEGGKTLSRTVGSGNFIEEHVVKLKAPVEAPSKTTRLTGQALGFVGQGLGAVMVVNTIRGQGELYKRWQEGRAGAGEMTLGTAHNLGTAAVGVQMVRGVPVGNGVFVVLSIIDIGQAVARTYSSTEERNIAITYTAIASALNLALMIAGQALMKIPNPVTMIAGFLLSFAGPAIMDALGVADWLERRYGFNPSDVIQVYQTLRKLVQEYGVVAGAITLGDRNAQGMSDLQVKDPVTFRAQAAEAAREARLKAIPLEHDILNEFQRAYEDAKTNYAGLKELDEYREQFLTLHHQANPGNEEVTAWQAKYGAERDKLKEAARQDPDPCEGKNCIPPSGKLELAEIGNPEPRGRKGIEEVFKGIEAKMSIDGMSEDAIRDMPQWKKLNSKLDDLSEAIGKAGEATEETDVEKLHKEDREAEAMISNARYRLDPAHQGGLRTTALLSANAPGRALYEQLLSEKEKRLSDLRYTYTVRTLAARGIPLDVTPLSGGPAPSPAEQLLTQIEGTMGRYEARLTMSAPPKELGVGLFTNSDNAAKYEQYLKEHPGYTMDLVRFEILEGMIDGLIEQAWRPLRAKGAQADAEEVKRLNAIAEKRRALHKKRYDELGIVFRSELPGLTRGVKSYEASELAPLLGEKPGTKLLSREEITALKSSQLEDQGVVGPITNRLMALPALGTTDAAGHLRNIYRFVGGMMYWEGGWIKVAEGDTIRPEQNVIVGVIGPGEVNQPSLDTPGRPTTRIIPINQAAVVAFRGEKTKDVFPSDLQPITKEELKP